MDFRTHRTKARMAKGFAPHLSGDADMRLRTAAVLVAAALVSTACAGPSMILLRNPATNEVVRCPPNNSGNVSADSWAALDCARQYEAIGYQRVR